MARMGFEGILICSSETLARRVRICGEQRGRSEMVVLHVPRGIWDSTLRL